MPVKILRADILNVLGEIARARAQISPSNAQPLEREVAQVIVDYLPELVNHPVMNTNTVNTDLKRTVIQQIFVRAFAIRTLPLHAFSTVFNGIRLEGTDKVAIPYF